MLESWGAHLKPAAFQGKLCFAPSDGRRARFTHPASWLGDAAAVEPGAALEEITRRYLSVNGPATREDLRPLVGSVAGQGPEDDRGAVSSASSAASSR